MFDEEELERAERAERAEAAPTAGVARPRAWAAGEPAPASYSIAGTWSGWHRLPMRWDRGHFVHEVTIGPSGDESFQILLNGNWDTVFYPSIHDGSPWAKCKLLGPDKQGHGRNWTIGRPKDKYLWRNFAKTGERYLILLSVDREGLAEKVTWRRLKAGEGGDAGAALAGDAGRQDGNSEQTEHQAVGLEWRPPASAQGGMKQVTGQARAGRGLWLVSEARADMELGDIILLRPGDVASGSRGLASRGGEVLRIEFVEHSRVEEWRAEAFSRIAPAAAASGKETPNEAAVGDAAAGAAEGRAQAAEEAGDLIVEVWRVPDIRGWGHLPAIKLRQPSSSLKVRLAPGKSAGDLKEAIRAGLPGFVLLWDEQAKDIEDWRPLGQLIEEGGRLFYELYHEVRIYRGGPGNSQRCIKVTVKASSTLYDVRAAIVKMAWYKYCDLQFVEEGEDGTWCPCDEDELLEGRTELLAVGAFIDELPAFDVDEEADVALWDGPNAGKRVRCLVQGTGDSGETYDVYVLPTTDYDNANGHSDTYVPRLPSHIFRKTKVNARNDEGPRVRKLLKREEAVRLLRELLAGYKGDAFQRRMADLLAHYPERAGYIADPHYYTGFYTMRKQVLLSLQTAVLPKYGFAKTQGGTVMMVTAIKQFKGDAEIDGMGVEINSILQPMYEETLQM